MLLKISHPTYPDDDFYVPSFGPSCEEQVNRLGPVQAVSTALDWPPRQYAYRGWTDTVNSIWWPRNADEFASLVLLLDDSRMEFLHDLIAQQVTATSSQVDPRPYVILSAILYPGETYTTIGITEPVTVETTFLEWKLYPLPPVKLTEVDTSDTFVGLWLAPLVDLRYFHRCSPLLPVTGGSSTASPSTNYPINRVDHTEDEPGWMPPLLAYPDDLSPPANYTQIEGNGSHFDDGAATNYGLAVDQQARMEGWRVVCRDIRSNYNAPAGATQHSQFTGIISDYPEDPDGASILYSASLVSGGQGYLTGEVLTVVGGTGTSATLTTVDLDELLQNGNVGTLTTTSAGDYSVPPASGVLTTTGGSGTGLTVRCVFGQGSYHLDAIRLASVGPLIAGGELSTADRDKLTPHKIDVQFRCRGDDHYMSKVIVRGNSDDYPDSLVDLSEDTTGLGEAERAWVPKILLGVEASSRYPGFQSEGGAVEHAELLLKAGIRAFLYWRWRARPFYAKYPLLAPVMPNGHAAMIRWDFQADNCSTTYIGVDGIEGSLDGPPHPREGLYARIDGEGSTETGSGSGSGSGSGAAGNGLYAWTELQQQANSASFEEKTPYPRKGFVSGVQSAVDTINPARGDNDETDVAAGTHVWLKPGTPFLNLETGLIEDNWRFTVGGGGTASDGCIRIVLTDKDYETEAPWILYSGYHVTDRRIGAATIDTDGGIIYDLGAAVSFPIYHLQNLDLVVWLEGGSGSGAGNSLDDPVPEECVYRVCLGAGDYYFINEPPDWEVVQFTGNPDGEGFIPGIITTFLQESNTVASQAASVICEIIDLNALD